MVFQGGDRQRGSYWICVLRAASDRDSAVEALRNLTVAIKAYANRSHFVRCLGDLKGMDLMARCLSLGVDDDELRTAFLMAIKSLLDSRGDGGYRLVSSHGVTVRAMLEMLDSADDDVVVLSVKMLCTLCWWRQSAYDAVLAALSQFAKDRQLTTWWHVLLRMVAPDFCGGAELAVEAVVGGSAKLQHHGVLAINAITNSPWLELEDRVFVRSSLSALGWDAILSALSMKPLTADPDHEALMEQIEVYSVTKQQDDHEKMVGDTDLSDPEAMWRIIRDNAIRCGFVEELTRILQVAALSLFALCPLTLCCAHSLSQNLLLIPNHQRALTKTLWSHCSKTVNVICAPLREQYLSDALQREVDDAVNEGPELKPELKPELEPEPEEDVEALLEALSPIDDGEEANSLMMDSDDDDGSTTTTTQREGDDVDVDDDDEGDAFYREREITARSAPLCFRLLFLFPPTLSRSPSDHTL